LTSENRPALIYWLVKFSTPEERALTAKLLTSVSSESPRYSFVIFEVYLGIIFLLFLSLSYVLGAFSSS